MWNTVFPKLKIKQTRTRGELEMNVLLSGGVFIVELDQIFDVVRAAEEN